MLINIILVGWFHSCGVRAKSRQWCVLEVKFRIAMCPRVPIMINIFPLLSLRQA